MKRNLILSLIACGAGLTLSPALHAQDAAPAPATTGTGGAPEGHEGHHGGGPMIDRLTTELSLTADQQAQLKPVLEAAHTEMQGIHQDTSLSQEDKRAKMKAARDSLNAKITAVLTSDQQAKFTAMQAKWHQHRQDAGAQPAASPTATP